jgi:hypothetical protein
MKMKRPLIPAIILTAATLCLTPRAHAAITGQWDFKGSNLVATIGTDLQYLDADTQNNTAFGSTAAFGISSIAGQNTNVMRFPRATAPSGGYYETTGASPNGGGGYVNQYTVIMDILYPSASAGQTRTLFVTDVGGEFVINASGALSFAGGTGGSVTPDAWHRIAITVDTTNTTSFFIDGTKVSEVATPGGTDGPFASSSSLTLFNDANTNSQLGYVASIQFQDVKVADGLIAALGGPVPGGILTGPPPNPYVLSVAPTSDNRFPGRSTIPPNPLLQIVIADGTATVNTNTVVLKLNGSTVSPSITQAGPSPLQTTVSYQVPIFLGSGSSNFVALTFQDSAAHNLGAQYNFYVGPYVSLPNSAAQALGTANTPGFIYRVAQAPVTATVANSLTRALQQLDGTLLDTNGLPFFNEATLSQTNIDQYEGNNGTVAFDYGPITPASFYQLPPTFTTYLFPGIPGTNSANTDNFSDDVLAYLQLSAGTYVFGVDVGIGRVDDPPGADDGYVLFCGANPRDFFATQVGQFARTGSNFGDHQNTNQFTFVAPVTGIYPFRLVHWQTHESADLGWYYVDNTGTKYLINEAGGAIPAYRVSTIPREPYIAEVYPVPGGAGFAASAPIEVVLSDDDLAVNGNSISLSLNGAPVSLNSSNKTGKLTTIVYNPNASRTTVTNVVQLVYSDNAGVPKSFTNTWSFTIVVGGATVPQVTGQWDFNNCDLTATVGQNLQYFDGPAGSTATLTKFGRCSSFGIPTINGFDATVMEVPGGAGVQGNNNFGYIMNHQIGPNGGGTRVNQYTIIWDMYYSGSGTLPFFQCQNTNNAGTDGSLFLQNGQMGQGSGGYTMNHGNIGAGWHRIAFSVDLAQSLITKWVDGIKQQDWISSANSLDAARRAWLPTVLLFADGDGDDHDATCYVNSIQVRNGKLSDAEMVALGGPSGEGIPISLPATSVTGQWDFNFGDLSASVGKDLQYLDGIGGSTATLTVFSNCSGLGIPLINGVDAKVVKVPGGTGVNGNNNFGYIMNHLISPNGGGTRVNQYTIIWDMYYSGGTLPFTQCQNTNNAGTDGSLFLQNGQMGQGSGGYTMNHGNIGTGWHRLAFACDLSQNLITKWVDGVKAQDWVSSANALDAARRSLLPTALLFADGDGDDHDATCYVKSIQISSGKLSDAQMVALGAPDGNPIPVAQIATTVTGQWDFNFGDLSASVGKDLLYFDGLGGSTATLTVFSNCSGLGIPLINGVDAKVMEVPGGTGVNGNNNFGYVMNHLIAPNGGGTRVNQYTIIWDMYYSGGVLPFFQCQNTNNAGTDGSLFLQNGQMGQGSGGYAMPGIPGGVIPTGWHRLAFASDLSQQLITKWVDGVKAQDWVSAANALDAARRAWLPTVLLFADGDGDDHTATCYVKSIQVSSGKMSDAQMEALGAPTGLPIPIGVSVPSSPPDLSIVNNNNGTITVSWPPAATGWGLESSPTLHPGVWTQCIYPGVVNNSITLFVGPGTLYFRLHK